MKSFTHPDGLFEINIPLDWHYKNEVLGYENKSPFSFELFENTQGCFQLSCYHKSEREISPNLPIGPYDTDRLNFVQRELQDPEFKVLLWATVVQDYFIMAKYICQPTFLNASTIRKQIKKVEKSLSTLKCLSPDLRVIASNYDRFEKFCISLAASYDLKNKAMKNGSHIELIIINASQIDAFLRLCIVHKLQILEKSTLFNLEYLYQRETDKPLLEKKIYDKAKTMGIISATQYKKLYKLYDLRNKVVHRYIITDIKTRQLRDIGYEYELLCEEIRIVLSNIEIEQFEKKVGYHGTCDPHRERTSQFVDEFKSRVNDKHFSKDFHRIIK
ncbi:MAG: hypothetical protein LAT57_14410 [Balneolales bacterium]|nr:hypothetical protein [Balneolales bacterium]